MLVSLDDFDLQQRRLRVIRILTDERFIRLGSVDIAFLVQVQITEVHVDDPGVIGLTVRLHPCVDAVGAVHVGEADRQDAERVLDEFAVGATQRLEPVLTVLQFDVADLPVEQFEERREAVLVPCELELRPT